MNPRLELLLNKTRETVRVHNLQTELPEQPSESLSSTCDGGTIAPPKDLPAIIHRHHIPPTKIEETPAEFSKRQVTKVEGKLRPLAFRIFLIIHQLACEVAERRKHGFKCAQSSFFCPAEAIYAPLGIHRSSFYRSLNEIKQLGLIDERGYRCTVGGKGSRCCGTLWCVNLATDRNEPARLTREDFEGKYRDLEADIRSGNTVWAQMRQSNPSNTKTVDFEYLLTWSLPLNPDISPVTMTVASDHAPVSELLLDVPQVAPHERSQAVDRAARAIATQLGDTTNLNFYRDLLWRLLRLYSQGRDHFRAVYQMILRAGVDRQEGFARRAGALFISRLKAGDLWDELRSAEKEQMTQHRDLTPCKLSATKRSGRTITKRTIQPLEDILPQALSTLKLAS